MLAQAPSEIYPTMLISQNLKNLNINFVKGQTKFSCRPTLLCDVVAGFHQSPFDILGPLKPFKAQAESDQESAQNLCQNLYRLDYFFDGESDKKVTVNSS